MLKTHVSLKSKLPFLNTLLFIIVLVALLDNSSINANIWTVRQSMMNTRRFLSCGMINNRLYAIGGDGTTANEEYDPTTNTWSNMTPMPTTRWWGIAAGVAYNKIYVMGGAIGGLYIDTNEEYDLSADTVGGTPWTTMTPMPTERCGLAIGVVNDTVYVIGGRNSSGALSVNEAYDPTTDSWSTKTPMPTVRYYHAIAVVNDLIYVIGGFNSTSGNLTTVEEYDPATDSWSTKTDMPTPRQELAAGVLNGKIYAVGGWNGSSDLNTNEEYDPLLDSWAVRASMPTARSGLAVGVIAESLYALGGLQGFSYLSTNERYTFSETGLAMQTYDGFFDGFSVHLRWITSSEKEYSHFIIARINLERETSYRDIGSVSASGNTSTPTTYTYTDKTISHDGTYHYKLGVVKTDGSVKWYGPISIVVRRMNGTISICPNPIRVSAQITYTITKENWINLSVYNSSGRIVRKLFQGSQLPGTYSLLWDCKDNHGKIVPAGFYFLRFTTSSSEQTEKVVIID